MSADTPLFPGESVMDSRSMTDRELLIRMDGRLGTAIATLSQSNSGLSAGQRDHETRIRGLEKKVWLVAGAAAVLGGLGGRLSDFLLP